MAEVDESRIETAIDALVLRMDHRFDALATRIYWTVGIGVALLTLVSGTVPYLLRVLFFVPSDVF